MRLAKLELLAFGPFRGLALDFSAPGIHVVLGRNEAGKSTTLRAITGLLYGIDRMTNDAHVHKPQDLRIGGVIENEKGDRVHVVRRKGNTNTLLDTGGNAVDEAIVKKLLGGVSEETFRHAFGLDHDTLEAGAKALLEGQGDLGESLFDASVGGGGEVQRLLADLTREADEIYKPRGSALPLNEALKAFADAQKSVRERESRPEAFLTQENALKEAAAERTKRLAAKEELAARRTRLERGRKRAPLERRHKRALEKHAELGQLATQFARVGLLKDRFGAYQKSVEQWRTYLADKDRLTERVTEAARRAGADPAAIATTLRLDARKEARVHTLLRERTTLSERIEASALEITRLERDLARLAEARAPSNGDGEVQIADRRRDLATRRDQLAFALERVRTLGDIEVRVAAERSRTERRRSDLETKANALGRFEGALDALVGLRVPLITAVERLQHRADDLAKRLARLDERRAGLDAEQASLEKQMAGQMGDFAPPDVAALRSARALRDVALRTLRDAPEGESRRIAELDAERLLREADAVADQMIREADRVTTLARLRSEAATNEVQRAKVVADTAILDEERGALEAELCALFADSGVSPGGFREMGQWLERHARIVEAHASLREAEAAALEDEARANDAKRELALALDAEGRSLTTTGTLRLADLVAAATARLAELEELRHATEEAARSVVTLRTKLDERVLVRTRDDASLAETMTKLDQIVGQLGVTADAAAEEVNRAIEALRELFELVDRRADAEAHARVADADVRAFEADLSRTITELAPDLGAMDLRDAATTLFSRSDVARENAQELAALEVQLENEPTVVLDEADRALLADPEATQRVEQELSDQLDEIEREATRLTEHIGGLRSGLEQLRAESHAADAAASAQQALARVRDHTERWCRARLAAVVLHREIERYREENQAPLLASSSSLFARLTLGSFSGVKAGFDAKDRPCLRCVRADGATEVDVTGLSDGTRDQLYLSLRLASLLRRADLAEPMPLILDDVLIQLDDQRAAAALSVLAEVSRRMQVLFFTHHARLVDLARSAVPSTELVVHELASAVDARPRPVAAEQG